MPSESNIVPPTEGVSRAHASIVRLAGQLRKTTSLDTPIRLLQLTAEVDAAALHLATISEWLVLERRGVHFVVRWGPDDRELGSFPSAHHAVIEVGRLVADSARKRFSLFPDPQEREAMLQGHPAAGIGPFLSLLDQAEAALADEVASAGIPPEPGRACIFRLEGEVWRVRFEGVETLLTNKTIGLGYIARLLGAPGRLMTAYDLNPDGKEAGAPPERLADDQAMVEYAHRYQKLQADLAKA